MGKAKFKTVKQGVIVIEINSGLSRPLSDPCLVPETLG